MAKCSNNTRLGRIGCGAEYNGELQHCVAKAPWSEHPDGRAHVTGRSSTIEAMWDKSPGEYPADPTTVEGLQLNEHGYWVRPMRESALAWATQKGIDRAQAKSA
jgi:hypothetical protein